ncbi:MAG: UDP-diphosphatase [Denitrovibrio sp.]|nr:MAG: UDP-diphosphatase [Denitrovibrio sp.]
MDILTAVILGVIQGLTEFLPVSSSGHLVLAQSLIKDFEQPGMLFDTLLHGATLGAVFVYFRKRILELIITPVGLISNDYKIVYFENKRFFWGIIIASVPTAIIGLFLESHVEGVFGTPSYVGYFLILTSVLLLVSDRFQGNSEVTGSKAFIIGIVQGLSVIPGISRAGSTTATGLFLGIKREEMAEFTFLMSVPAIIGAIILQSKHITSIPVGEMTAYIAGMAAAFISGFFAIGFMVYFIKRANLKAFALYCLIVGIVAIIWM